MKNWTKWLLALALAAALTGTALAAEFPTAYDLYSHWDTEGYPDYVCDVTSTDGGEGLTVLLVAGEEARADEVRAMVDDQSTLTVETGGAYAYNELLRVHAAIVEEYMQGADSPVLGCGIGWHSVDGEVVGFGESGRESRVVVSVRAEEAEKLAAELGALYGGMICVESMDGEYILTEDTVTASETGMLLVGGAASASGRWALPLLVMLLAALTALLALRIRRPRAVTADGPDAPQPRRLTRRAVRARIQENAPAPQSGFEDLKKRL